MTCTCQDYHHSLSLSLPVLMRAGFFPSCWDHKRSFSTRKDSLLFHRKRKVKVLEAEKNSRKLLHQNYSLSLSGFNFGDQRHLNNQIIFTDRTQTTKLWHGMKQQPPGILNSLHFCFSLKWTKRELPTLNIQFENLQDPFSTRIWATWLVHYSNKFYILPCKFSRIFLYFVNTTAHYLLGPIL